MKSAQGLSGEEFVQRVFAIHKNDLIETLLNYCGGDESDILEFKASIHLLPTDKEKFPENLYWHYAREIIAMANTRGGLFVIGVHDSDHKVLPFEANDPNNKIKNKDLDAYIRDEILAHLFPQNNVWKEFKSHPINSSQKFKAKEYWIDANLSDYTEGIKIPYKGHVIYGYIVRPTENRTIHIHVRTFTTGQPKREQDIVPYRIRGHVGKCDYKIGDDAISKYENTRNTRST